MKKKISFALTLMLFCLHALAQYPIPDQAKVLFIGNSLFGSSAGGVPAYTDAALKAMGYNGIQHGMIGNWGEALTWGLTNLSKYNTILPGGTQQGDLYNPANQLLITDAILNGPDGIAGGSDHWDYVILQGYGDDADAGNTIDAGQTNGVTGAFFNTIVQLDALADQVGAKVILYMRWPNNPETPSINWFKSQLALLTNNYDTIAAHIGAEVVPIAIITDDITFLSPPDTSVLPASFDRYNFLYGGDNIHPSDYAKGMFAYATATILARQTPVGVPFAYASYTNVPGSIDTAFQTATWKIIAERESWADPNAAVIQIVINVADLTVPEGGSATFGVRLNAAPADPVTVVVGNTAGDTDLAVTGGASLIFNASNWEQYQTVTVSAAEDADGANGKATIACSATGLINRSIIAEEVDNDLPPGVGKIWAESNGVVTVEAATYFSKTARNSHDWTLQSDGVLEAYNMSGVRGTNYLTLLPDINTYTSNTRTQSGTTLLLDYDATVDYQVYIATPGTYRLHLRAAGHDNGSETLYAGIVELRDGDGGVNGGNPEASGDILADWYRYIASVSGTFAWISTAEYESDDGSGAAQNPDWTISQPGIYTIRVSWREDGISLDALVLQLNSLPAPTGSGPAASAEYVATTPFQAWTEGFVWTNPVVDAQADVDYDQDGFANLIEFENGTDPTSKTSTPVIVSSWVDVAGTPAFALTLRRRTGNSGVTVYATCTTNLVSAWFGPDATPQPGTVLYSTTPDGFDFEKATYRPSDSMTNYQTLFLRGVYQPTL